MIDLASFDGPNGPAQKATSSHADLKSARLPVRDSTICIVDDDPGPIAPLSRILGLRFSQRGGLIESRQQTCESSEDLASWVIGCNAKVLITDNNMHGALGVDVIAKIHEMAPEHASKMSFIIVTGMPDDAEKMITARDSASGNKLNDRLTVLCKPVQADKIVSIIDRTFVENGA